MQNPMNPRPDYDRERDLNRDVEPNVNREPLHSEPVGTPGRRVYDTGEVGLSLVRWGPIVAGFAATMAVLILLGVLGTAIGLPPMYSPFWAALSLIVAFFVGGWVCASTLGLGGQQLAVLHGGLVWSFTLLFILLMAGIGAAGIVGVATIVDGNLIFGAAGAGATIQVATSAWAALIAMLLGLAACIGGALVAMRRETSY